MCEKWQKSVFRKNDKMSKHFIIYFSHFETKFHEPVSVLIRAVLSSYFLICLGNDRQKVHPGYRIYGIFFKFFCYPPQAWKFSSFRVIGLFEIPYISMWKITLKCELTPYRLQIFLSLLSEIPHHFQLTCFSHTIWWYSEPKLLLKDKNLSQPHFRMFSQIIMIKLIRSNKNGSA